MFKYPFTPITGQDLGISYSSLNQIGDILPSRTFGQAKVQTNYNVANGNLFLKDHSVTVKQMTAPLNFGYVYNSQASLNSSFALSNFSQDEIARLKKHIQDNAEKNNTLNAALFEKIQAVNLENNNWTKLEFERGEIKNLKKFLIEKQEPVLSAKLISNWNWKLSLRKQFIILPDPNIPTSLAPVLYEEDGYLTTYSYDPDHNMFFAPGCANGTPYLRYDQSNNNWIWYHPGTEIVEIYSAVGSSVGAAGLLLSRTDREGRTLNFNYTNSELSSISTPTGINYNIVCQNIASDDNSNNASSGYVIAFYEVNNGDNILLQMSQFDDQDNLIQTTTPQGYEINYAYKTNLVTNVDQTDNTNMVFVYDNNNRISILSAGDTLFNRIDYSNPSMVAITDSFKIKTQIGLDSQGRAEQVIRERGYDAPEPIVDTTQYTYCNSGQLATIVHPDNGQTTFQFDPTFGYKIQSIQPNGQKTEFYYETGTDRPKLVTHVKYLDDSRPIVTRFVYEDNYDNKNQRHSFLRYKISPEGRVTEYRPDERGNPASARVYTSAILDVSQMDKTIAPSLYQMTAWVAAQPPQNITLTEFEYDSYGQLNCTRKYPHVDNAGNGIADQWMSEDYTFHDKFGNLRVKESRQTDTVKVYTKQIFDDLQRLTGVIDALENKTQYQYSDARAQITQMLPNGRIKLQQNNPLGLIDSIKETADCNGVLQTRNTAYQTDSDGRSIVTTQPDSQERVTFYDRQQRLGFTLSPQGLVTEFQHDLKNHYKKTIQYNTPINVDEIYNINPPYPGELPSATKLIQKITTIQDPKRDRVSYEFYDLSGRTQYEVSSNLAITEYLYDNLNRKLGKIVYSTAITRNLLNDLQNGRSINLSYDPDKDSCELSLYDKDNNVVGQVDAKGYLTEFIFDAAGRRVEKIVHEEPIPLAAIINNKKFSLEQCRPTSSTKDAHTYYYFNAANQCIAAINNEGYYIKYTYLACGLPDQTIAYDTQLDPDTRKNLSSKKLPTKPLPSPEDQTTSYTYNKLNQVVKTNEPFNKVTNTTFDIMQNLTAKTISDALVPEKIDQHYFDVLKQVLEASPIAAEIKKSLSDVLSNIKLNTTIALDPDHMRATLNRYDGWSQMTTAVSGYASQLMAIVEASNLSPQEKLTIENQIWQQLSTRNNYDNSGLKLSSVDVYGYVTYFYYNLDRRLTAVVNPKGVIKEFKRNTFNEVEGARSYFNSFSTAEYQALTGGFITQDFQSLLDEKKDPERDAITVQARNNAGLVETIIDAEGYLTAEGYNMFGQLATKQVPVTDKNPSLTIEHDFDPRGKEKETRNISATLTTKVSRYYDNPYGKQTAYIDELDRKSQTEYNPLGLAEKEIDPENIIREIKKYDAFTRISRKENSLGNIEGHFYNQLLRTHTIQKPDGTKEIYQVNVFGDKINFTDGLDNQFNWKHDPNGKITLYQDALNNITLDGYDLKGRHFRHTDANGIVTDYEYDSVDNLINKIFDINGLKLKTHYIPDVWGRNELVVDPNSVETKQIFDKRNLLTQSIVDPVHVDYLGLNLITSKAYNGQKKPIGEWQGDINDNNQYAEAYLQDELNRDVGKVIDPITPKNPHALAITDSQVLDKASQVVVVKDANGNMTYKYYDKCGRERFVIAPLYYIGELRWGSVTEKRYDTEGHVTFLSKYKKALDYTEINENTPLALMDMIAKNVRSDGDSQLWSFYDSNGREQFTVNSLGYVEEKVYDNASHIIKNCRYAKSINPKLLPELNTNSLSKLIEKNSGLDRITYTIRDNLGRARFVIDPKGYVLEQRYDNLNQIICKKTYATPMALDKVANLATLTPEEFSKKLILDVVNDRAIFNIFDSRNKPVFTIDPEGAVTRYEHDSNGNLTEVCKFAKKIKVSENYEELVDLVKSLEPNSLIDRITKNRYNKANQLIASTNPQDLTEYFKLNALGKVTDHIDFGGSDWQYEYDRAKRQIGETSPTTDVTFVQYDEQTGKLIYEKNTLAVKKSTKLDKLNNVINITEGAGGNEPRAIYSEFYPNKKLKETLIPEVAIDDPHQHANFAKRPEKMVDVTTGKVYDGKGNEIVSRDEAGNYSFKIYDSENRLIFSINANGAVIERKRNSFGEVKEKIKYDKKLLINLNEYRTTGLPLDVLKANLQTSLEDRITFNDYDLRGDLKTKSKGPIFFYTPAVSQTGSAKYGFGYAVTKKQYNAFRQCIHLAKLINPQLQAWSEEWHWFNRNGKELAVAKKLNQITDNVSYSVTRQYRNVFNEVEKKIEFATEIPINIDANTTLAKLAAATVTSPKDRIKLVVYNKLGRPTEETRLNIIIQKVGLDDKGCPYMYDEVVDKLTRYFEYGPIKTTGPTVITYEDGKKAYYYYDNRGFLIAKTGVPRTSEDEKGNKITLVPLTTYGINSFGQRVMELTYALGTSPDRDVKVVPVPLGLSDDDQCTLTQFNKLGLAVNKQDAENNLKATTYTAFRKGAREFGKLTNWKPIDPANGIFAPLVHIDEKQFIYDVVKNPKKVILLRDNETVQTTEVKYNAFNEDIAEGPGDGTWPRQQKFDGLGNVWINNFDKGGWTIFLHDLTKKETAKLQTPTGDFENKTLDQLLEILQWDISELEKTESLRDSLGRAKQKMLPAYPDTGNNEQEFIPIAMVTGNRYPNYGKTSITWVLPQERTVQPRFYLWPVGSNTKKEYSIYTEEQRCGVDVSFEKTELSSGIYQYEIDYFFTDPVTGTPIQLFTTTGTVQFDNGNNQNSNAFVAIVEHENQLILSGNNAGLTAIELWQDNTKIAEVPVQKIGNTVNFNADLSGYPCGQYEAKPVINNIPGSQLTLPFSIFTAIPSQQPLAREISCEISLSFLEKYGLLTYLLPPDFAKKPIKIECVYFTEFDRPNYLIETVDQEKILGEYNDFSYNILFPTRVKKIVSLSAFAQTNNNEWLPLQISSMPSVAPSQDKVIASPEKDKNKKDKPKKDKSQKTPNFLLQGKLSNQKQSVFLSSEQPKDKAHDLMALGVAREQLIEILLNIDSKTRDEFSEELADQIKNDFLNRKCLPFDEKWRKLSKDYFEAKIALEQTLRKIKPSLKTQNIEQSDINLLLNELQKENRQTESTDLLSKQFALFNAEFYIKIYCSRPDAYEHYINNLNQKLQLNATLLKIYGKLANISYTIWQRDKSNPFQLDIIETYQAHKNANEIHLVKTLEGEHYTLLTQVSPINNNIILANQTQLNSKEEEIGWQIVPNADESIQSEWEELGASTVNVNKFPPRLLLTLSPLTNVNEFTAVSYLDTSLDLYAKPKKLNVLGYTHDGLIVDVTGFLPGVYPVQVGNDTRLNFTITNGGSVYCSDEFPSHEKKSSYENKLLELSDPLPPIHPIFYTKHDVWNNPIQEQDSEGNIIDREFNPDNKFYKVTQPEVLVFDDKGGSQLQRPIIQLGYNCNGVAVGKTNANNNTEISKLDEAGQLIEHILGDGTVSRRQILNALGQVTRYFDASNNLWLQKFNRLNLLVEQTTPMQKVSKQGYNEQHKVNINTDPGNNSNRYNFDINNMVEGRFEPGGQFTGITSDRNGQPLSQKNADGTSESWVRDYHGVPSQYVDLNGTVIAYSYDKKIQLVNEKGSGPSHGLTMELIEWTVTYLDAKRQKMITTTAYLPGNTLIANKELNYTYVSGRLMQVQDKATGKTIFYDYNKKKQRNMLQVNSKDGSILRRVKSYIDALGRDFYTFDTQMLMIVGFDAANNRRCVTSKIYTDYNTVLTLQQYNTFDKAERVLIDGGILDPETKQVVLAPDQGFGYDYSKGLREKQQYLDASEAWHKTIFDYDKDAFLLSTQSSDGNTSRQYNIVGWQNFYSDSRVVIQSSCDQNAWLRGETQYQDGQLQTQSTFRPTATGEVFHQLTSYYSKDSKGNQVTVTDSVWDTYLYYSSPVLYSVGGTRTDPYGSSPYTVATQYFGPNGELVMLGNNNQALFSKSIPAYTFAESTYDSLVLEKLFLFHPQSYDEGDDYRYYYYEPFLTIQERTRYFYTVNGDYLGSYSYFSETNDLNGSLNYHYYFNNSKGQTYPVSFNSKTQGWQMNGPRRDIWTIADSTSPFIAPYTPAISQMDAQMVKMFADAGMKLPAPTTPDEVIPTFPPAVANTYVVSDGDTFESISQKQFGTPAMASALRTYNNFPSDGEPTAGYRIKLPQFIPQTDTALDFYSREALMAQIMGQLYPALATPQPPKPHIHHSFLAEAINFFVDAVAVAIGVGIPGIGLPAAMAIAAASAALMDTAAQYAETKLGLEPKFNWREVFDLSLESALSVYDAGLNLGPLMNTLLMGVQNAGEQLSDIAIGATHRFDVRSFLASMATEELDEVVDIKALPNGSLTGLQKGFNEVFNNSTGNIIQQGFETNGRRFNMEEFGASFLGTTLGQEVGARLNIEAQALGAHLAAYVDAIKGSLLSGNMDNANSQAHSANQNQNTNTNQSNHTNNSTNASSEKYNTNGNLFDATRYLGDDEGQESPVDWYAAAQSGNSSSNSNSTSQNNTNTGNNNGNNNRAQRWSNQQQGQATWSSKGTSSDTSLTLPQKDDDSLLEVAEVGLGLGAVATRIGQYSNAIYGEWRGLNGKWYNQNSLFFGNQYTGSRNAVLETAEDFEKLGKFGLFAELGLSAIQAKQDYQQKDYIGLAKSSLDAVMSIVGEFGVPGFLASASYKMIDLWRLAVNNTITITNEQYEAATGENEWVNNPNIWKGPGE